MTEKEFIFCCELLYKHYKGKKLNDIIDPSSNFVDYIIENVVYERQFLMVKFKNEKYNDSILYFNENRLKVNGYNRINEFNYDKVEDFLKAVKIPLEDIV